MPRETPKDFERPARVVKEPKAVGEKISLATVHGIKAARLQAHYLESHRAQDIPNCCKDTANLSVQWYCMDNKDTFPDFLVIECSECGRKHRRAAGGKAQVAAQ